jgi:hypothetical protein
MNEQRKKQLSVSVFPNYVILRPPRRLAEPAVGVSASPCSETRPQFLAPLSFEKQKSVPLRTASESSSDLRTTVEYNRGLTLHLGTNEGHSSASIDKEKQTLPIVTLRPR